ncbi:uncharacterized protein LOC114444625 [Parambassis ranga]|uniref:Uncharacterized protein LOC114444625 n=1 Tax=Parambassis ranga TaxID=210632 RepID=A0A6P7JEK3_9TELE|nr:uncharacterized protein LOC114444625 [Parambassis ranga]
MTDTKKLLLIGLLLTGAGCQKKAVFVYSRLGGEAVLPCSGLPSPSCSSITWTFYKGGRYTVEVSGGRVEAASDKASRMSVTSSCSLRLRSLRVEDAGSYVCNKDNKFVTDVYLSLLSIGSQSAISELRPGGRLVLSCLLFTFYDAGSCKSYSSGLFSLQWAAEDGTVLTNGSRYQLTHTRCNITLVTELQVEDNNRKWRCQVNTTEDSRDTFLDFTSAFLLQQSAAEQSRQPAVTVECPVQLPFSRIVLCAALPLMVVAVGVFTWRLDRKRAASTTTELQEVH